MLMKSLMMAVSTMVLASPVLADGGITYDNIADDGVGLTFVHGPAPDFEVLQALKLESLQTPIPFDDVAILPQMTGGWPGVAVFDYDRDGDLDIYVSNSAGFANGLFQSQLSQNGTMTFVNVAAAAGVAATDHNSSGVCFGDIDNDGDHDLVVLGRNDANKLFENLGNGSFAEIANSGIEGGTLWSSSASMGDVNGDGRLDLIVANVGDSSNGDWVFDVAFALNEHNQLFINNGNNTFTDVSASSGIQELEGFAPEFAGSAGLTWATVMVDIDMDGDLDILFADDQAALRPAIAGPGGIDRGFIHVLLNDGSAHFTDHPIILNAFSTGAWMGLSVGDLNCDGALDLFATNFGDYAVGSTAGVPGILPLGLESSRWFLGNGDGTFTDPGVGGLIATPFAWGTVIYDYDNDCDLDILSHGGIEASTVVVADNPGAIHQNQSCSADFVLDNTAIPDDPSCVDLGGQPIPNCTEHIRRNVRGLAVGDLDRNGFLDIVTVSSLTSAPPLSLLPAPDAYGSVFDETALFATTLATTPDGFVWIGVSPSPGDLAVEMSTSNGNGWAAVTVRGSIGLTSLGRVNRDGIGAILSFTPTGSPTVMQPVTGGSSHCSQNSLERIFGLGAKQAGTLEVMWPGGVRNRLYDVGSGERVIFPEIPCSFDGDWPSLGEYTACVTNALTDLHSAGVLDSNIIGRFVESAVRAFQDEQ